MAMEGKTDGRSDCREETVGVKKERGRQRLEGERRRDSGRADNEFRKKEQGHLHYK